MNGEYEVAVSRYTFVDGAMQRPLMQLAPRVVTGQELQELLASYQLRFIQPTLHMNRALAIGSGNVEIDDGAEGKGLSTYFGMIVRHVDGDEPQEAHVPLLAQTFGLEVRERFLRIEQSARTRTPE